MENKSVQLVTGVNNMSINLKFEKTSVRKPDRNGEYLCRIKSGYFAYLEYVVGYGFNCAVQYNGSVNTSHKFPDDSITHWAELDFDDPIFKETENE